MIGKFQNGWRLPRVLSCRLESQLFSIEAEEMLKSLYTEDSCIALLA